MENFEQLVRKTMKEYGIDGRLTNIILSNKSPEEIVEAIEKTVIEIAEEKKKAEENKLEREIEIKATITEKGTSLEIESETDEGTYMRTYMLGEELLITAISLVGYLVENLGDEESKGVLKEILEAAIENPNLMCRLISTAMLTTKNARDSLK